MPVLDAHALHLIVRWSHVAAMATALGGALLITVVVFSRRGPSGALAAALAYERLFWAAAGVLVMTGVGNLGAFGRALPEPRTDWGSTFTVKLVAVALLLAISLPRTLAVLRLERASSEGLAAGGALRTIYAGTVAMLAVIVFVAEVLAH
ncbi:MAG TPA: hypothetical protein VFW12_04765 [Candidatus Limnocylindria bacterium]|nr:hypothetical protein [Candidatus Limnocylindria bacterium]